MAEHNELGKEGEQQAAEYLLSQGYAIRHRNWRCGHKELDIVAEKEGVLVVVEVKTRRDTEYGRPEEAVTNGKIRRIVSSADAYLRKFAVDLPVRFDLITMVKKEEGFHLNHIEDAFRSPLF
ncbi:MAG: YraN family protein [Paraprevotella sp.]|nr:YraN family protein [Paraprevotella sp.]